MDLSSALKALAPQGPMPVKKPASPGIAVGKPAPKKPFPPKKDPGDHEYR